MQGFYAANPDTASMLALAAMERAAAEQGGDTGLFFAGEATDTTGYAGTVHCALATGLRAVREFLRAEGSSPGRATAKVEAPF